MKALRVTTYGGIDTLTLATDVPEPVPAPDELLIDIHAVTINPFDIKLREGLMRDSILLSFPYTFGGDFSGTVTRVGNAVMAYREHDAVFGTAIISGAGSGAFAQKATVKETRVAKKPSTVDVIGAASLPLVGTSALQALDGHMMLDTGKTILIHGGAGGIGSIAVQLARARGARVYATAAGSDQDFVMQLGAHEVADYKTERFEQRFTDLDFVFDTVGGGVTDRSLAVLKKGGLLVTMAGIPDESRAAALGVRVIRQKTKNAREHLSKLSALVDQGAIRPVVDRVFPLESYTDAFVAFVSGRQRGKIVLTVQ